MVAGMSDAEKDAFRTGVARSLYGTIMDPSSNFNAASRIINSPETTLKLQPLFDDPSHFRLFKAALEREAQLFQQANKILGGSQTAKRSAMRESLDEGPGVGEFMVQSVTGGFWPALTSMAARMSNKASISPQVADKLADMLMAKNPADVAAVVKFLEQHAAGQAPRAVRATAGEAGTVTGATTSIFNPPAVEGEESGGIESAMQAMPQDTEGESELEREWRKMQAPKQTAPDTLE
jgi:hypothetical protein